jgi:hypothetical protein
MIVGAKFISPALLKRLILLGFRAIINPVIRLIRPKRLIRPITLIDRYSRASIHDTLPGRANHEFLRPTKSRKLNFEVERLPFKDCLVSLQSENIFTIQNGNY